MQEKPKFTLWELLLYFKHIKLQRLSKYEHQKQCNSLFIIQNIEIVLSMRNMCNIEKENDIRTKKRIAIQI